MTSWEMWATPHDHLDGEFLYVCDDKRTARMYSGDNKNVPVTVAEDPDGTYLGWITNKPRFGQTEPSGIPEMIQYHVLFEMQFPYGSKAEVERGHGRVVRLTVTLGKDVP